MIYINTVNYSRKIKAHLKVNRKVKKAKSVCKKLLFQCAKRKQNNLQENNAK